ncbi:MAG: ATP-dependent zinc metalloprotease FtsH [Acidobacteriota bacterium]|nr:ATP-dependent zinc metalloprotease FtsH [Acidobacteriota bacterium]
MAQNNKPAKNLIFWIASLVLLVIIWTLFPASPKIKQVTFTEFLDRIDKKEVQEVIIQDTQAHGKLKDGTSFKTTVPGNYPELYKVLRENQVNFDIKDNSKNGWLTILLNWFPIILLIFFWFIFMRQMQSGGNKALAFGKSRAKLFSPMQKRVTFKDVAGVDEAKIELQEIIEFLKDPRKFQRLGGRIPKGVLLVGAPGTGKTLLARAVAGEANVPFFSISGSDFVEMFVGVGASRVRDLFEQAKKHAPCLIFIDEIDAVGRQRGAGLGGGHDEREQTLNQLLVEMDGFDSNEGIIVIAATNRPDILDTALLRPGRFDRRIIVPMPDIKGREEILNVHSRRVPLCDGANMKVIARSTPGFSGADLANLINEAALMAARKSQNCVNMRDLEEAKDKVLMGVERKSMIISDEDKRNTAFHEAGHALVAALLPEADPIHKVTIIPRGLALGLTQQLPLSDRYTYTKNYLDAQLAVLLAGRVTEEMILGKITTGAANDLEKATEIARKMVCQWGMSDLGPLSFGERDDLIFLGRELAAHKNFSEHTAELIDGEVKKIIGHAYELAKDQIEVNRDKLFKIAEALLEKEILSSDEINALIEVEPKDKLAEPAAPAAEAALKDKEAKPSPSSGELKLNKQPQS